MSKGILKRASGTILQNSSPDAIEEYIVKLMKEALGEWQNSVKIKPFLRVDEEDADMSNNVKNGFGAIELNVYGTKLYIPFMIVDKTLLPFDTIRLGEQEISYDYSKLRRVVNAIEHKAKEREETDTGDESFQTMELADYDDIQYNNGFLGTIMQIRDHHKNMDARTNDEYKGSGFGTVDENRIMRYASDMDVLQEFHEVMDKVAQLHTFTPTQLEAYERQLIKEAEAEEKAAFEKQAAEQDSETLDAAKVKRDMANLQNEKLFNVHRAASGNNIAFPVYDGNRLEFRSGRVYRNFQTWFKNTPNYTSSRIGALVLDSKGGYTLLKTNQPFMASVQKPDGVELPTNQAKALRIGPMYILEKDSGTVYNPFVVEKTWLDSKLNDGIVLSYREGLSDPLIGSRSVNSLFHDVFYCKEVFPGRSTNNSFGNGNEAFSIIVAKTPAISEPTAMSREDVQQFIMENADDQIDASLAKEMLFYTRDCVLVPQSFPFFVAEKNLKGFYTRPDGLFKEGPLSKTAAYDNQNKATLYVEKDLNPKSYSIKWSFTKKDSAAEGVEATKREQRSQTGLSKQQAQSLLGSLGFDYRTQARFFEITDRNGRSATFSLPDVSKAEAAAPSDKADSKVKKKMKAITNSMLHSQNFMPMMTDSVAGGISDVLGAAVPGTITAAHNVGDFFGMKSAKETATEMEKVATDLKGARWHELSALLNMKYRLDKVAKEVLDGNYVYKGSEVFEKVAEFKPVIEKAAKDLIQFNRQQLINTDSYLIKPSLVKEALHQLDGLYMYASSPSVKKKSEMSKEAGIFQFGSKGKSELANLDQYAKQLQAEVNRASSNFTKKHAHLRASLKHNSEPNEINRAMEEAKLAENELNARTADLQKAITERGDALGAKSKKNIGIGATVGLPGLAGLSYANEHMHDKREG